MRFLQKLLLPVAVSFVGVAPFAFAQTAPTGDATALVGKAAPGFALPDQNNKTHALADNKGKWVVLAFYPKDMTTGCTLQNKSYSATGDQFAPLNAVVYTVSTQDTKSKQAFCSKEALTHTLLSDEGGKIASAYGVLLSNGMARRVTFYVAPDGTVASVDAKPRVANAAQDSLATLIKLGATPTTPTEVRAPIGGGNPVVTEKRPNQFVGPALSKVTMDALVPDFALPDARTGKTAALSTLGAGKKATVVFFVATQCPVSNDYNERMAALASKYGPRSVAFVGINPNHTEPAAEVARHAEGNNLMFPVLKDADGAIADRFGATKTPEAYVLDAQGVLVYHGRIDDQRDASKVKTRDLAAALDAVLAGQSVPVKTTRAFGCSIKRAER